MSSDTYALPAQQTLSLGREAVSISDRMVEYAYETENGGDVAMSIEQLDTVKWWVGHVDKRPRNPTVLDISYTCRTYNDRQGNGHWPTSPGERCGLEKSISDLGDQVMKERDRSESGNECTHGVFK